MIILQILITILCYEDVYGFDHLKSKPTGWYYKIDAFYFTIQILFQNEILTLINSILMFSGSTSKFIFISTGFVAQCELLCKF